MFESTLERDLAYILVAHPDVVEVNDQKAFEYVDTDGVERRHTFDFRMKDRSGRRTAIAVKPARKVESSGIRRTLDVIQGQAKGFADSFEIRTGDHITRDRAFNARLIVKALRMRNVEDVAAVMAVASTLRGTVSIGSLLETTRNDGHGFMAVVCLIGDGVLEHVGPARISRDSAIRPTRNETRTH